jgi:hypothetical protein
MTMLRDTPPSEESSYPQGHSVVGEAEGDPTIGPKDDRDSQLLPPPDTKRWSSRRKAAVLVAIRSGVITREDACQRYMLSDEELASWESAFDRRGIPGLRITSQHTYRAAMLRKLAAPSVRS